MPRRRSTTHPPAPPAPREGGGILDRILDAATLALALWWLVRLAGFASGARYQTDECFHALMAERFAAGGGWPRTIPELYSGFAYYYPPLFHWLGAAVIGAFGADAFRWVNVIVSALLLATLWLGARALGAPAAGRWAVALCVANGWLSLHAVRLYVEQLTTLLVVAALVAILRVRRSGAWRDAAVLGVAVGLGLVAKHSALVLLALVLGLAGWHAVRRQRVLAMRYLGAAGVAVAIGAPMFARNAVLYGSPIYPALAPDLHPLLDTLNRRAFTPDPRALWLETLGHTGVATVAVAAAGVALAAWRRRGSLALALLAICGLAVAAGPLQPMLDARHLLPVIAGIAFLGALALADALGERRRVATAIGVVLIAYGAVAVARMPDHRRALDAAPESIAAYEAVGAHVPAGATVLSLHTYDTFYYGRRPATWPIPWGQRTPPIEMFLTAECDSVLAALRAHGIEYALAPRAPQSATFDGASWPATFIACIPELMRRGDAEVLWYSESAAIVRFVPAPDAAR